MELLSDRILPTPGAQACHVLQDDLGLKSLGKPLGFPWLLLAHEHRLELQGAESAWE